MTNYLKQYNHSFGSHQLVFQNHLEMSDYCGHFIKFTRIKNINTEREIDLSLFYL